MSGQPLSDAVAERLRWLGDEVPMSWQLTYDVRGLIRVMAGLERTLSASGFRLARLGGVRYGREQDRS